MTPPLLSIRVLEIVAGTDAELETGLLCWLRVEFGGMLAIDGLTLRRTIDGRHAISFPRRRDPKGHPHVLIAPVDNDARRRIEETILEQLGLDATSPIPTSAPDTSTCGRDRRSTSEIGGSS